MLALCTKEYHTAITPSTGSFRRCSSTRSGDKESMEQISQRRHSEQQSTSSCSMLVM